MLLNKNVYEQLHIYVSQCKKAKYAEKFVYLQTSEK